MFHLFHLAEQRTARQRNNAHELLDGGLNPTRRAGYFFVN